ncbi:MAG: type IV secretory system conjugative DNA transfer family protein [Clostridia bacterium]|nr:type IV secretory system conjugative DNA transfer family protein [Clostridia bacterium]
MKLIDKFLKYLKTDRNTFLTYILTLISLYIVVDRLIELFIVIFTGMFADYWGPIGYTLALACPIFAFLFCSGSKFVKSNSVKLSFFYLYATTLYIIALSMMVQGINYSAWMGLYSVPNYSGLASQFPYLFKPALSALALYLPLTTFYPLIKFLYATVNDTKSLKESILDYGGISLAPNTESVGAYACEVSFLKDVETGKAVKFPEKSRFTSLLVVGASGTGKTSMIFEPMIAKDIEKKAFFKQISKELGFTALKTGLATLNKPYDNNYLNKNFNLNMITANTYKQPIFNTFMKKMIYSEDSNGKIFRNLGITSISPDPETISKMKNVAENFNIPYKIIDIQDSNSLGLNPFVYDDPLQTSVAISSVLKGMYSTENTDTEIAFQEKIAFQAIENVSILLKEMYPRLHDGILPTLEDMLDLFNDFDLIEDMCEELKKIPELNSKYNLLIGYFTKHFYKNSNSRRDTEKYIYSAVTQLDNLLRHPGIKQILCNRTNNLNYDEVLENGEVVFACTRRGDLGASSSKAFGLFFLLLMQFSVLRRPGNENSRIPHTLYIDEYPDFNCTALEPIFTIYRKYKIATTISAQSIEQLDLKENRSMKRIILTNCASKIVFGNNTPEENSWWAKEFGNKRDWQFSNTYDTSKGEYDSKLGGIKYGWTNNLNEGKVQTTKFKNCSYKLRNDKGRFVIGTGSLDFLEAKYKTVQKEKTYNFEKVSNGIAEYTSTKDASKKGKFKTKRNLISDDNQDSNFEIDPIKTDNSDSNFLFDNDDAIIFDLKNSKK